MWRFAPDWACLGIMYHSGHIRRGELFETTKAQSVERKWL
jgi:hypothetical protein